MWGRRGKLTQPGWRPDSPHTPPAHTPIHALPSGSWLFGFGQNTPTWLPSLSHSLSTISFWRISALFYHPLQPINHQEEWYQPYQYSSARALKPRQGWAVLWHLALPRGPVWMDPRVPRCQQKQKKPCNIVSESPQADLWGEKRSSWALRCLWEALGGKSIIAERAIYVQHEIVTDTETFLALVDWVYQPPRRPLFIWADNCSWLFCSWADDYKLLSEMIWISGVKWGLRVTQSGEQTTSSKGENKLYKTQLLFFNDEGYFWLTT